MVKVLRADKSPLNKKQWLCELECGHEQWVTSTRKPIKVRCYECDFQIVKDAEQSVHPTPESGRELPAEVVKSENTLPAESG